MRLDPEEDREPYGSTKEPLEVEVGYCDDGHVVIMIGGRVHHLSPKVAMEAAACICDVCEEQFEFALDDNADGNDTVH